MQPKPIGAASPLGKSENPNRKIGDDQQQGGERNRGQMTTKPTTRKGGTIAREGDVGVVGSKNRQIDPSKQPWEETLESMLSRSTEIALNPLYIAGPKNDKRDADKEIGHQRPTTPTLTCKKKKKKRNQRKKRREEDGIREI